MIKLQQLTKFYGNIKAVDGFDLHIKEREIFGLLGPNGAGKTTTVKILTTLTKLTSGRALINGFNVVKEPDLVKKEIGIIPQETNLDLDLTARENLELHGRLHHIPKRQRRERIKELLSFVGLLDRQDGLVKEFSSGMKRRLLIARGLMHYPKILFMDEPTVGLDPQTRRSIWKMIRSMNEDGMTILLTTHYIEEAQMLCHRVGIIDYGKLTALGTSEELLKNVGEIVVESLNGNEVPYKFFKDRKSAEIFARRFDNVIIRLANLEDVFIKLTGHRIRE